MFEPLPETSTDGLLDEVLRFRSHYDRYEKPDDINALIGLFPNVSVRDGYLLDYVQAASTEGVIQPIRPFARPGGDESWIPMFDPDEAAQREELVEELYQYLQFEHSAAGLFEYAFFVIELWSMRASRHAAEWLESTPIFTEARFDQILEKAGRVSDLRRPEHFGPLARIDTEGGRVRFLVHTPLGWERIYYLESMVYGDGFVDQEAGEIVADLGSGHLF